MGAERFNPRHKIATPFSRPEEGTRTSLTPGPPPRPRNSVEIRPAVLLCSRVKRGGPAYAAAGPLSFPATAGRCLAIRVLHPESRVCTPGLLFTCYHGKTTRLVPACDRRVQESCDQSPKARGNRPLVAHLRRTVEIVSFWQSLERAGKWPIPPVRLFAASEENSPLAKVVPCRACTNKTPWGPERSTKQTSV